MRDQDVLKLIPRHQKVVKPLDLSFLYYFGCVEQAEQSETSKMMAHHGVLANLNFNNHYHRTISICVYDFLWCVNMCVCVWVGGCVCVILSMCKRDYMCVRLC